MKDFASWIIFRSKSRNEHHCALHHSGFSALHLPDTLPRSGLEKGMTHALAGGKSKLSGLHSFGSPSSLMSV
jgi:hypothetical protein